ncbi:MAG: HlyD family type I secretion periplasmic adaptor subunit [Aliihoeflea sp.]
MQNTIWAKDVKTGTAKLNAFGLLSSLGFCGLFAAWAFMAPLAGASIAQGVVAAAGQNVHVQHLEGGLIREVLVTEGERVSAGDPLFRLDETAARAQVNRLTKQLVAMRLQSVRLAAERDGLDRVVFPDSLLESAKAAGLEAVIEEQRREFQARHDRHGQELEILAQRAQALEEQIVGMTAQVEAVERHLAVVEEEEARKKDLLDLGLTNRSEYTDLLRSRADLLGQLGQARAGILAARTQIAEADQQLARSSTQRVETAVTALNELNVQITDLNEQLSAASAILERIVVRSPADGLVISIAHNSPGRVVRPGETMLELLPTAQDLIVEARVEPRDIDLIAPGQAATLRFSALNARNSPTVEAKVYFVSADRRIDENTGMPFYAVRLSIAQELPDDLTMSSIYPGMPVETYLKTGDRTFASYLVKPITDSFNRAFLEE